MDAKFRPKLEKWRMILSFWRAFGTVVKCDDLQ